MTDEMKNLLLTLGGIIIALLVIIIIFGGKSPFMKLISFFLEEEGGRQKDDEDMQPSSAEPKVEMVKLIRKSDDRLRIFESDGTYRLVDEYYELEFLTRKGKKLIIECSRDAYEKMPFNEDGSLTYKRNRLVKFKYYEGIVFNSTEDMKNG